MKSSPGLRIAVVTTLCVQPFFTCACTNDDVDFTMPAAAGNAPRAGSSGMSSGVAGVADAGAGASVDDGGAGGSSGEGDDAGAAGSDAAGAGDGGAGNAPGEGGNAGRSGGAGFGGVGGNHGGGAGRAGSGAGGAVGGAGLGGSNAGGAGMSGGGAGGSAAGTGGSGGTGTSGGGAGGAAPVCGNQVLEKGEQCDDGNTKSLDACSATCGFEQSQRANSIEQKFKTSSLCPRNAFGAAFEGAAQTTLQTLLDQRVANGSLSLLFAFRGLRDLSGMSTETIQLGMAYGAPSPPIPSSYDGKSDLDWWYTPANGQVDSSGVLYSNSTGYLVDGVLDASPDSLRLPLLSDLPIYVSNVKVRLSLGDSSAPLASTGAAPGHLASEHVRPGLMSFASGGPPPPVNGDPGQLCGGLSAASLAGVAIPAAYATGGSSACLEGYAPSRTFLELLVGGCTVPGDELIAPTQPDVSDPGAPAAGAGAPYRLLVSATTGAVIGCCDKNNAIASLNACLNAAAYSAAFRLKTGRVVIK